jgi:hypothetical protein
VGDLLDGNSGACEHVLGIQLAPHIEILPWSFPERRAKNAGELACTQAGLCDQQSLVERLG